MNEEQRQRNATELADQLRQGIYDALLAGDNVLVTVSGPIPHCSGNAFWNDRRTAHSASVNPET